MKSRSLIKKSSLYLILSILTILYWIVITDPDNYSWQTSSAIIENACSSIFYYKLLFWLSFFNILVFALVQIFSKKWKSSIISVFLGILLLVLIKPLINEKCAYYYYQAFVNQTVAEPYLLDPIKEGGDYLGFYLDTAITNKSFDLRRYAIQGLAEIEYEKSAQTLKNIRNDSTEPDYIINDAKKSLEKLKSRILYKQ